jgi:hypothetical protein
MRTLFAFIGWLFKKSTQGIRDANESYREFMEYNPWPALVIGLLASALIFIFVALATTFILEQYGMHPTYWILVGSLAPQITYIVYTFIVVCLKIALLC